MVKAWGFMGLRGFKFGVVGLRAEGWVGSWGQGF